LTLPFLKYLVVFVFLVLSIPRSHHSSVRLGCYGWPSRWLAWHSGDGYRGGFVRKDSHYGWSIAGSPTRVCYLYSNDGTSLAVDLWSLGGNIAAAAVASAACVLARASSSYRESRRLSRYLCTCGYSLIGNQSGRCPECARAVTAGQTIPAKEIETSRRASLNPGRHFSFSTIVLVSAAAGWLFSMPTWLCIRAGALQSGLTQPEAIALVGRPDTRTLVPADKSILGRLFSRINEMKSISVAAENWSYNARRYLWSNDASVGLELSFDKGGRLISYRRSPTPHIGEVYWMLFVAVATFLTGVRILVFRRHEWLANTMPR